MKEYKYQTKLITEVGVFTYQADYLATLNAIELAKSTNWILEISTWKEVSWMIDWEMALSEVITYVNVKDLVILVVLKLMSKPCGFLNNFMYVINWASWIGSNDSTVFNSTITQSLTNKSSRKSETNSKSK